MKESTRSDACTDNKTILHNKCKGSKNTGGKSCLTTNTPKSTGPERLIIMGPGAALSMVAAKFALQSHSKPHSAKADVLMPLSHAILARHRFHKLALANQSDSCYIN